MTCSERFPAGPADPICVWCASYTHDAQNEMRETPFDDNDIRFVGDAVFPANLRSSCERPRFFEAFPGIGVDDMEMTQLSDQQIMYRLLITIIVTLIVFGVTAEIIGEERKARWFQKRTKFSWFLRRGLLGEKFHYGYPKTLEGIGVFLAMLAVIALCTWFIFTTSLLD